MIGPVTFADFQALSPDYARVPLYLSEVEYRQWVDEDGAKLFGTVLKGTEVKHGIVRQISADGEISEA